MIRNIALTIRKHQGPLFAVFIAIGIAVSISAKNQYIPARLATFWSMIIVFLASFIESALSLVLKESVAKGVIIKFESSQILYWISVAVTIILCLLSLAGVVYYY